MIAWGTYPKATLTPHVYISRKCGGRGSFRAGVAAAEAAQSAQGSLRRKSFVAVLRDNNDPPSQESRSEIFVCLPNLREAIRRGPSPSQAAFAHQVVHGMRCRGQVINRCIAYREATNANIARVELTYGKLKNAFHPRS